MDQNLETQENQEPEEGAQSTIGGLFEDERRMSEDDLKGVQEEAAPESGQELPATVPPQNEEPPPRSAETPVPPAPEPPVSEEKPPAGYVKLEALHEERGRRKELQQYIAMLEQRVAESQKTQLPPPPPPLPPAAEANAAFKDFKVLSDSEFAELAVEDPAQAIVYTQKLRSFERYEAGRKQVEEQKIRQQQETEASIREAVNTIQQVVPDIYDSESETNRNLTNFAYQHGFKEYLPILTDPRTVVVPAGGRPVILGKGAAELISFINGVYRGSDIESRIKEREQVLRDQITAELTEKFKTGGISAIRSLDSAPSSTGSPAPLPAGAILSEDDWANLSPADRQRLLRGQ